MKFLIVEDEKHLNDLLYDYLLDKYEDANITQIFDGYEALINVQEQQYDLILIDVMLPAVDGFDIIKKLRESQKTPVIMLSALNDEDNQIKGYNLGIDEYVTKPYSPKLVMKKVEAILNRLTNHTSNDYQTYGIIQYNLINHTVLIEDEAVTLNKKEWDLLTLFLNNPGRLFSREDLLNKIWGFDYFGDSRTVDTHIRRLRRKINNASTYIKTVFKEGYKLQK